MFNHKDFEQFDEDVEDISSAPSLEHTAVMTKEVLEYLQPVKNGVYVDCTLGLGGHARLILNLIGPGGRLIGLDRDAQSLKEARERLHLFENQCEFINDDYRNLDKVLKQLNISNVDGIIFDLGISSFQLNDPQRGFSLRNDGPLDMRMDQKGQISAFDLINSLSEKEIDLILKDFGEERFHHRIARLVVRERAKKPIETTKELSHIVLRAIPGGRTRQRIHPATRTFQALRIAVNRELDSLENILMKSVDLLKPRGKICVIAFHSLEDRIVKLQFRNFMKLEQVKLLTKKPLRPTDEEVKENPRARSARLRVAERI